MGDKNIFKGLNIDREKLPEWIQEFAEKKFESFQISDIHHVVATQYRCKIDAESKEIIVDFYYANNGKTTIRPTGQHTSIGVEIAAHIKAKLEYNISDKSGNYSVCPLPTDEFNLIIEFFENELEGIEKINQSYNETQKYILYQFQSRIADKLTLKYYETTNRLQVQGKPMFLYQEITSLLADHFPFDEVVKNQAEIYNVNIRPEEVREEMKELMPTSFDYLGENLKKILAGSVALQKIDIILDDYSPFVFPALKTLEGFMKQILMHNGIIVSKQAGNDSIGSLFGYNGTRKTYEYSSQIGKELDDTTKEWLNKLYNYFIKQRHSLFHVEVVDAFTRIISTKQEADHIISKVITLLESAHNEIPQVPSPR